MFLRKIIKGGADKSYGIQVARLAGVPEAVLARADQLAEQLSQADITGAVETMAGKSPGRRRSPSTTTRWISRRCLSSTLRRTRTS